MICTTDRQLALARKVATRARLQLLWARTALGRSVIPGDGRELFVNDMLIIRIEQASVKVGEEPIRRVLQLLHELQNESRARPDVLPKVRIQSKRYVVSGIY
jgi:hypothetical protein